MSPIDGLSDDLFFMHMVQHVLLMMVGPPLILVGAPVVPVLRGLPRILRDDLAIPLLQMRRVRKILNFLASPLTAWMVFVFTLWIWHVPALYNEAVINEPLHFLEHMMFMGAASSSGGRSLTPFLSSRGSPTRSGCSFSSWRHCRARRCRRSSRSRKR